MPTVLVYRSNLLPHSETFIKEQLQAYRNWRAVLVGRRMVHELPLDGLDVELLEGKQDGFRSRLFSKARCYLGGSAWLTRLRKETPSLLHAHFGPEAVSAEPIAKALGIPMVVTLHGYDINIRREWWESGQGGPSMRRYPSQLLRLAAQPDTHFLAVSDAVRQRAIAYGIAPDKVTVSYIGVDAAKFIPGPVPLSDRLRRVLFVGRLVEKKGCEYLLRAMQIVKSHIPAAELTIVGDGPLRADLETLSVQLGVDARFTGALPADTVRAELDNACVFCLPSVRADNGDAEGFGLVLLEAQAAGVPVVSSAFGGAKEGILHGQSGFQFEEREVGALAGNLIDILDHPEKAAAMGLAARRFVQSRFDIQQCTGMLEHHYNDLAGRLRL